MGRGLLLLLPLLRNLLLRLRIGMAARTTAQPISISVPPAACDALLWQSITSTLRPPMGDGAGRRGASRSAPRSTAASVEASRNPHDIRAARR